MSAGYHTGKKPSASGGFASPWGSTPDSAVEQSPRPLVLAMPLHQILNMSQAVCSIPILWLTPLPFKLHLTMTQLSPFKRCIRCLMSYKPVRHKLPESILLSIRFCFDGVAFRIYGCSTRKMQLCGLNFGRNYISVSCKSNLQ